MSSSPTRHEAHAHANMLYCHQTEDVGPDFGDKVDMLTFSQILEMDEDETERDFSKPLVMGFFEQAEETFEKMDTAL